MKVETCESGDLSIELSPSYAADHEDLAAGGGASRAASPAADEGVSSLPDDDDDDSTVPFAKSRSRKKKLLLAGIAVAATVALVVGLGAGLGTKNAKRSNDASAANSALNSLTVEECMAIVREDEAQREKDEIEYYDSTDDPTPEPTTYPPTWGSDNQGMSKDDGSEKAQMTYSNDIEVTLGFDGFRRDLRGEGRKKDGEAAEGKVEERRLADKEMKRLHCQDVLADKMPSWKPYHYSGKGGKSGTGGKSGAKSSKACVDDKSGKSGGKSGGGKGGTGKGTSKGRGSKSSKACPSEAPSMMPTEICSGDRLLECTLGPPVVVPPVCGDNSTCGVLQGNELGNFCYILSDDGVIANGESVCAANLVCNFPPADPILPCDDGNCTAAGEGAVCAIDTCCNGGDPICIVPEAFCENEGNPTPGFPPADADFDPSLADDLLNSPDGVLTAAGWFKPSEGQFDSVPAWMNP